MRHSAKLNELVTNELVCRTKPVTNDVIIQFKQLILEMKKDESTIHSAMDKLDNDNKRRA